MNIRHDYIKVIRRRYARKKSQSKKSKLIGQVGKNMIKQEHHIRECWTAKVLM